MSVRNGRPGAVFESVEDPMKRFPVITAVAVAIAWAWCAGAQAADVHVGINIGVPPPPVVALPAPPRLIIVPDTPAVRYAPEAGVNLFVYGRRYYTYDNGAWFVASGYGGPWVYVEPAYVPRPLLVVPARYYHAPPRWHHDEHEHYHGRGHGHGHDHDRDHGHGHGHGHD